MTAVHGLSIASSHDCLMLWALLHTLPLQMNPKQLQSFYNLLETFIACCVDSCHVVSSHSVELKVVAGFAVFDALLHCMLCGLTFRRARTSSRNQAGLRPVWS